MFSKLALSHLCFYFEPMCSDAKHCSREHNETDCIAYANVSEFKVFQVMMFSHFCRAHPHIHTDAGTNMMGKLRGKATEWDCKLAFTSQCDQARWEKDAGAIDIDWLGCPKKGLMVFWNGSIFRFHSSVPSFAFIEVCVCIFAIHLRIFSQFSTAKT